MAVLVPSRGRPKNVARLIREWDLRQDYDTKLVIAVDSDDPRLPEYEALELDGAQLVVGGRRRLGGTLNALAPLLAGLPWGDWLPSVAYDIVGFMGDDHVPRTPAWDHQVRAAMVPGGVVYGNDLIQGAALPTAVFMDSRIIRTLGWFVVPGMTHLFMDNLWKTLGEQLGTLRYLPDVIIEHVHPIAGKAEWDAGYVEANDGAVWEHDEAIYREWVAFQMPADIAKIKAAL